MSEPLEVEIRVADLTPTEFSARRNVVGKLPDSRVSITAQVFPLQEADNQATVVARVRLTPVPSDDSGLDESTVLYEGSAGYLCRFDRPVDEEDAGRMVDAAWPFLRLALVENAGRLQMTNLKLPSSIDARGQDPDDTSEEELQNVKD